MTEKVKARYIGAKREYTLEVMNEEKVSVYILRIPIICYLSFKKMSDFMNYLVVQTRNDGFEIEVGIIYKALKEAAINAKKKYPNYVPNSFV